jgi:hypothetical protein
VNSQLKALLKSIEPNNEKLVDYLIFLLSKIKRLDTDIKRESLSDLLESVIYA